MVDPLPPAQDPSAAHLESAANLAQHEPQQALVHAVIALVHEQRRAAEALEVAVDPFERIADRLEGWNTPLYEGQGAWRDALSVNGPEREVAWRDR